jgi:hypothetical protein
MKILTVRDTCQQTAKSLNKWCLFISFTGNTDRADHREMRKAVPYLDYVDATKLYCGQQLFLVCDDKKECHKLFDQTVGDDGPTLTNSYNGYARVYAEIIGPDGKSRGENT